MKQSIMLKAACAVALAVFAAHGADGVAGKWSGVLKLSAEGQSMDAQISVTLRQNGSAVTGTFASEGKDPLPIRNGKFEGGRLTFEVGDQDLALKLDGTLSGEMLSLKVVYTFTATARTAGGSAELTRASE
jgi:hypothetical protein